MQFPLLPLEAPWRAIGETSLRALLAPLALCALLAAWTPAQAADPALERATELSAQLLRAQGRLEGLGPAVKLVEVLEQLNADDAQATLAALDKARLHPLARAVVAQARAREEAARGARTQADALTEGQGFVRRWWLIGPFPGVELDQAHPPEDALDPQGPAVTGRNGEVSWRALGGRDRLGEIDAETLLRPIEGSTIYAAAVIRSPRRQKAALRIGAEAAYQLWLGGRAVGRVEEELGGHFDRDAWGVTLEAGDNVVLLKLANELGGLTFSLRVTDAEGAPLKGVSDVEAPEALRAAALPGQEPHAGAWACDDPVTRLEAVARAIPDARAEERATALAHAALLAWWLRPEDPLEPHRALLQDSLKAGTSLEAALIEASIDAHQWRRREAITRAAALAPNNPWIGLRQALIALQSAGDAHFIEARHQTEALLGAHPDFGAAGALLIDLDLQEGMSMTAMARAVAMLEAGTTHRGVLRAGYNAAQAALAPDRQGLFCQVQRRVDRTHAPMYGACASLLLQAGQGQEAAALVAEGITARPDITGMLALAAQVDQARGQEQAAAAVLEQLTALIPGESAWWQQLGEVRLRLGDPQGATAAFERSLQIEPRNAALKARLDQLAPRPPAPEEAWALELPQTDPEALSARHGADDQVVLIDQKVTRLYPDGLTSHFVQRAWLVNTENGLAASRSFQIAYTPSEEHLDVLSVRVTRPDGTVRQTWQSYEQSLSEPWYNLYYDLQARVLVFPDVSIGDVVEVRYRVDQLGGSAMMAGYFGDLWFTQGAAPRALTRYVLLAPASTPIHARPPALPHDYREEALELEGVPSVARSWTLSDTPAVRSEERQPGLAELTDYLHLSTYQRWEEVAAWYWTLIEDQLVVDAEIERIFKELNDGVEDRRKQVAAIHNYVVKNTRYVGLEFGIHSFKPYRTTLCLRRRFGDCKDKASLIKVMLDTAGIKANVVLVRTRSNGAIDPSPPSLQIFDHAIAYVPELDLFLDGTAEYSGTGELPWGDQGVSALIVEDGGTHQWRTIPIAPATDNAVLSSLRIDLTGPTARVDASRTVTGAFAAGWRQQYGTAERQQEDFGKALAEDYGGARLGHLQLSDLEALEAPVRVSYQFEGEELATRQGDTLRFLPALRPMALTRRLAPWPTRQQPLAIGHPFVTQETFVYTLPAGATATRLPAPTELVSPFGRFSLEVEQRKTPDGPQLELRLHLQVDAHRVSPEDYPALRRWLGQIDQLMDAGVIITLPAGQGGAPR